LGGALDVLATGIGTDLFDPDLPSDRRAGREHLWDLPYVREVREAVAAASPAVRGRLTFPGAVSEAAYARILGAATFVAHNVIADNGTFSVVEAALLGSPSISSDYPQMRELDEAFGLGLRFFDPFDERSTAEAIRAGESLPRPSATVGQQIRGRTWRSWDDTLVDAIRQTIETPRSRISCL
jgi:glycosyltransferase involved in cell wall biosynthesis